MRVEILDPRVVMHGIINDISTPSWPRVANFLLVEIATDSQMHHLLGEDLVGVQDVSHVGKLDIF